MKYLIINADDFGHSKVFNAKILELIKGDFVFSTTAMVDRVDESQTDQIKELAGLTSERDISVGLHLEFVDDHFAKEIKRQYDKFYNIFGFKPSHLDLHKAHFVKESLPHLAQFCLENNLPHRNQGDGSGGVTTTNKVIAGTRFNFDGLKELITNFKDGESNEILFHPGEYDPESKSSLNKERELDFENVIKINPLLKENNVELISFLDLKKINKS